MSKVIKGKPVRKGKHDDVFPLERENYIILGVGLLFIVMGYVALSGNVVEGFRQLTLAPLLLLLGYCVIIPFGIMYRKKSTPAGGGGSGTRSAAAAGETAAPGSGTPER